MKRRHWQALAIAVAGFVLLAGCSSDEPSQQSTPETQTDESSDTARTDTPADTGTTN